jgi:hypothetical protein
MTSIHFDNEPLFETDEINDVRSDRLLPTEFEAIDLSVSESSPQSALSFRRFLLKFSLFQYSFPIP